jgi:nucleoside-diphosphate-sugar epimerase
MSPSTFLASVILEAKKNKKVLINESPASCKDYISVKDAVKMIENIAISGKNKVYNVASGTNINHFNLANKFKDLGYEINFAENSPTRRFPQISIKKFQQEFPIKTKSLLDELNSLINSF